MPIITNLTTCMAHGINSTPCWLNYTLNLSVTNASIFPNPIGIVTQNLPWFGLGLWTITYVIMFMLYYTSGGKEKLFALGVGGFLVSIAYAQLGILGQPGSIAEISVMALSFVIMLVSTIVYALFKD